ncbi:MAG: response regulator [Planctomycetes bacterium]|nr:response regulator [Planctomycetota bacterium]
MTSPCDILHVDDNVQELELMRIAFEDAGGSACYHACEHSVKALAKLEELKTSGSIPSPHLIVLDVNMPNINGIELLERLQQAGVTDLIPVVMLTTSGRPEDEQRCLALGARAYLVKPDRYPELVELAKRLLSMCS